MILLMGLELHTVTDRLIARGLSTRTALAWLGTREVLWTLMVTIGIVVGWRVFGWNTALTLAVWLNAVLGVIVQELFRALVMVNM